MSTSASVKALWVDLLRCTQCKFGNEGIGNPLSHLFSKPDEEVSQVL